jgi:chromosome segregation ATPase
LLTIRKAINQEKRKNNHIKSLKLELEEKKKRIFDLENQLEDTSTKKLKFERDIRRMEEKNNNLTQKVADLKEDIEESELQRVNEKRTKNLIREQLVEQKALVRKLEGEIIVLEMKLDELKSHDQIVLKERDQYSDSKFHLEGKLKKMEISVNQHKKEYLEMLQQKEELELKITELTKELRVAKKGSDEGKMDWIFIRKLLHLAGKDEIKFNLKEGSELVHIIQMQSQIQNLTMTQMIMVT